MTGSQRRHPIATILVVDDERSVTEGLAAVLSRQPYEVLRAHSAEEALALLRRCHVDLIISDEAMPGIQGSELLRIAAQTAPSVARILLTGKASLEVALKAINEGKVSHLLQKPCSPAQLREAIHEALRNAIAASASQRLLELVRTESGSDQLPPTVGEGGDRPSANVSRRYGALDPAALGTLSQRELEVLDLLLDGRRVPQVAKALFISPHTVRNHLKAIFEKMNVHSQEELLERSRGLAAAHAPEDSAE